MAKMLLRTRKSATFAGCVRIGCVLTVGVVIVILARLGWLERAPETEPGAQSGAGSPLLPQSGRKLLAVQLANEINCTTAAILEFPSDGLTREQRQHGWIIMHMFLVCYLFIVLAVVCDDYFVPAIKKCCDRLHMSEDIAGATFMAMASSSPELFINCIGTFVTEGDIGIGAIVGSAVFNILAVPACCGLFATSVIELYWWPLSRDSMMYGISVILLIVFLEDGRIYMHEAFILFMLYVVYILVMVFNGRLMSQVSRLLSLCRRQKVRHYREILAESDTLIIMNGYYKCYDSVHVSEILNTEITLKDCEDLDESTKIWEWPSHREAKNQLWWIVTWPISLLLCLTIPDCRRYPRLYLCTFFMCILWIASTSYFVSWLITAIGDTLNIPDSVMGLTFMAAGMSVPEAVSSVAVTNQGHGSMGLSSSIGSNTFDILLCLGLPWLIKTAFYLPSADLEQPSWIQINSAGISCSAVALLSTLIILYISIVLNKFRLNSRVGLICLCTYVAFLLLATLIELNVFFDVNWPTCDR